MILIVGGIASGKRAFAAELAARLGLGAEDVAVDAHELAGGTVPRAELADLLAKKAVVTVCEVGSGIVPLDPAERAWREEAGRLTCELAVRADAVVRMVCGIPVTLKGTLPESPRG